MNIPRGVFLGALLVTWPIGTVWSHEVLHQMEEGKAVAVKVSYADGEPLMYSEYQVFSPKDKDVPHQKGRTDRAGYVSFVPEIPGKWRLKVMDTTGHGLDVDLDVKGPADHPAKAPAAAGATTVSVALRPLSGALAIALIFGTLFFLYRRKERTS